MDPLSDLMAQSPLNQLWIRLFFMLLTIIGLMIVMVVQGAKRNRLLKSIDRSLKALPAVQNQRKSA